MKEEVQDKRTAVLEATLKLIAEQGFHATPMSQIATQANISVGTIYHYFASKEDLINELYIHLKTKFSKVLSDVSLKENRSLKEQFILANNIAFRYFIENPNVLLFFEQYTNSPMITAANHEKVMRLFESKQKEMEKNIKKGLMKKLPIEMIHSLIHGALTSLIKFYFSHKDNLSEDDMQAGFEAIWDMVKK